MLGIGLAFSISWALNHFFGVVTLIDPFAITTAFVFSGLVGIFFGFYSARKAALLNPIDALRYE